MELVVAFALNSENQFEKKHFGDAEKYNIYTLKDDNCVLISEETNTFKDLDETHVHGSKKKGESIIQFLKSKDVSALVSKQFGANIKIISKHFVPVIIHDESIQEVTNTLLKHLKWVHEESQSQAENYKLFSINNGILKSVIDKV